MLPPSVGDGGAPRRCRLAPSACAERGEVKAVEVVGLAARAGGEELVVGGIAKRDKGGGVACEVGVQAGVAEVPLGSGEPRCGGEPPLIVTVSECRDDCAV